MSGRIFQLNVSDGGVPKRAVRAAYLTRTGLEGDRQRDRRYHGGPERALCLYSLEQILELQAEGHPIFPGSVGENLTLAGLDLRQLVPGARLAIGEEVLIEISSYTTPCRIIAESFVGGQFKRISQKVNPGDSRLYARVLQTGTLAVGHGVRIINGDADGQ
jgi:MOSC domain-containing protein YiiM